MSRSENPVAATMSVTDRPWADIYTIIDRRNFTGSQVRRVILSNRGCT